MNCHLLQLPLQAAAFVGISQQSGASAQLDCRRAFRVVLECFLHLRLFQLGGSKMVLQGQRLAGARLYF